MFWGRDSLEKTRSGFLEMRVGILSFYLVFFFFSLLPFPLSAQTLAEDEQKLSANQGQLKYMAFEAYLHFKKELSLIGGAGEEVETIVKSGWFADLTEDYQPATLGQLKYLAKPFYDRINMAEVGISTFGQVEESHYYPWWELPNDDPLHHAVVSLGQLNQVFSFDLLVGYDQDEDGLPDFLEWYLISLYDGDAYNLLTDINIFDDFDGDGVFNYDEFISGSLLDVRDSITFYSGVVYLNNMIGRDEFDGRSARVIAGSGPKQTFASASEEVQTNESIIAFPGDDVYLEKVLDPNLKEVTLKPLGSVRFRPKP